MILTLDQLVARLNTGADPDDTRPSDALWIKLAPEGERNFKTVEFRTPDDNTLVHIYVDKSDCVLGIEIFP